MLDGRKIIAVLAGETLEGFVSKGCLQGGMLLSPLLWSLFVDKLMRILDENHCYTLGYADDIAILVGKFSKNHLRVFRLFTPSILSQYFLLIHQLNALNPLTPNDF
jgi:hypothetical protein